MTSDDQFFFDYLSSIPNDVKKYSLQVADSIDRHVEYAAVHIRDNLSHQSWLPSSIRPKRPPQRIAPPSPPKSLVDGIQNWILTNRAWSAAALAFVGTGVLLIYGNRKFNVKKRRARKAGNGARREIVVISGSPHEPMTRSIASDLERRGYIVFITVTSHEEESAVHAEGRSDIRPLFLDLTTTPSSPSEIHPSLHTIYSLISQPQVPMQGVPPHICQLSGLVLIPSPNYPSGPLATIPASSLADTVNTRLLSPILTTQLFLPLLTLKNNQSSILLLYPSISTALSPPFSTPEVAATQALSGFATSLRRELRLLQSSNGSGSTVDVVELKLGNIDLGPLYRGVQGGQATGTEVLTWNPQQRALYGPQYLSNLDHRSGSAPGHRSVRGTPARDLHFAVFDALAPSPKSLFWGRERKPEAVYVGRGSRAYALVGNWVPGGLVGWMLGLRSGYQGPAYDYPRNGNGSGSGSGSRSSSSGAGWERVG
ncbi:hypothetical protein FQN54_008292 [Arachnomyces sp. PD_36]|nr:hypothetical protein FQN54_008292 [Arachnomyces sp. PD_36]